MDKQALQKLEFNKVKERVYTYAMSYLGRRHVSEMQPHFDLKRIERLLLEAQQAMSLIAHGASVPIPSLEGMEKVMGLLGKGYVLDIADLSCITKFIESTQQLKKFMFRRASLAPAVSSYAYALESLDALHSELTRCLHNGQVVDDASRALAKTRKEISTVEERLKKRIESIMHKYRHCLQDNIVSLRGNRYVIPVKKTYKKQVEGTVLDESASGQTVFMEPAGISVLQQELATLQGEEEYEITRILSALTGWVENHQQALTVNLQLVGEYDFLFAKAKYGYEIGGKTVTMTETGEITIRGGKHPLLGQQAIPLDFSIGQRYRALLITGPNTGGKTVSLKTVGLLSLMVQSGLPVPVQDGSSFTVLKNVLVDIGDGQSIEQSLSTFSAHIQNVIRILDAAGPQTLVLLDELASGTDPGEGIGLSIAVLEELYHRRATIVATTHFHEIKAFAEETPGFQNARMEFDVETLQPLYRLRIGEAGSSYALAIAQRLGMSEALVRRSREIVKEKHLVSEGRLRFTRRHGTDEVQSDPGSEAHATDTRKTVVDVPKVTQSGGRIRLQIGDRVWIHPLKRSGIVSALPDARGNVEVMVQRQRMTFNVKRIAPYLTKDELYPNNYDLDIVLESKVVRKKRKIMARKHVPGISIEHPPR